MNTRLDFALKRIDPLVSYFPEGILRKDSPSENKVYEYFQSLETIIKVLAEVNTLKMQHALLQAFPRHIGSSLVTEEEQRAYLRDFLNLIVPPHYGQFTTLLNNDELEIFMKQYAYGHELWGHPQGVVAMVSSMLHAALTAYDKSQLGEDMFLQRYFLNTALYDIPVSVLPLEAERREIPEVHRSRIGKEGRLNVLGQNFITGTSYNSRPRKFVIEVGPISESTLEKFNKTGWAEGALPSQKLKLLLDIAEPFYFTADLRFILDINGFILGKARIGKDTLGDGVKEFNNPLFMDSSN